MSYISESVPDLLGGVSQLAPQRRAANEVESMVNCQLRPAEGVTKRPPTKWIAEVAASATAYNGAMVHPINKNANERYWVIVLDGDLKVFDAVTGVEVPVTFPDGKSYLDVTNAPNESFRLATFNDTTVVVNREFTVDRAAELSTDRPFEALLSVNQTDWDVHYSVNITFLDPADPNAETLIGSIGGGGVTFYTPQAVSGNTRALNTSQVATDMAAAHNAKTTGFGDSGRQMLTYTASGNNVVIGEGVNFPTGMIVYIQAWDGLADQGMTLLHNSIKSVDLLPENAPVGFRIKVEGDPIKSLDDVYYEFNSNQVWVEVAAPRIPIAMDTTTLPLELRENPNFVKDVVAMTPTATFLENAITEYSVELLESADGTASTAAQAIVTTAPGTNADKYLDLTEGNGSSAVLKLPMTIDETQIVQAGLYFQPTLGYYAGDSFSFEVWMDDGLGGGFALVRSIPLGRNNARRTVQLQYDLSGVTAGADIRLRLVSAAGNRGAVTITYDLTPSFELRDALTIHLPTSHYAPSTAMSFTLNGTAFSDTYVAGGTRAAYMTNLKTQIEAYGGAAVTATIDSTNSSITVTNDAGTVPTIASFVFDDNIDLTQDLFNGEVDFVALGSTIGDLLKNLTDTSEGTITTVATTILSCSAGFSGGVNNVWTAGDKADVKRSTVAFVCREAVWGKREVGTEETNKWPAFDGGTINEVGFLKNRLVLLSDENVVMSEVDEFFNFFRSSTIDVLDSDRIDVALAGNKASALHSAFVWNETLLTWSELGQFVVNGEPFLSPNTVRREATTAYLNTRKVRPVTSERGVYFLTQGNEFCQLWDYKPTTEDATSAEGNRLSVRVPRYMPGTARSLLAVSDPEVVLVLTSTDPEKLYVYTHLVQDQQRVMAGWHEWSFAGVTQILGMGSIDNEVSLIFERDDGKVHLEVLDMWELSEYTVDAQEETDDMADPPVYDPVGGFQLLIEDDFTVSAGAEDLATVYDPGPTPYGGTRWEVGSGGSTPYQAHNTCFDVGTGFASPARLNVNVADDNLQITADFKRSSLLTSAQHGGLFLCQDEIAFGSSGCEGGIKLNVDGTNITISLTADTTGAVSRSGTPAAHGVDIVNTGVRMRLRKVGTTITAYQSDFGTGANETLLDTLTLTAPEQAYYEDGAHRRVGFVCTGTGAGLFIVDDLQVHDVSVVLGVGTNYTPSALGDATLPSVVGVQVDGTQTALTRTAGGGLLFPDVDVSSENVVVGIPVASTIVLSKLYHRKNFGPFAGQPDMRGATYISLLQLGLLDTTSLTFTVDIEGHVSFTQTYAELSSLDAEIWHQRVGGRNNEVTLTISDSTAANFKIVGFDWEGTYFNRTRRLS